MGLLSFLYTLPLTVMPVLVFIGLWIFSVYEQRAANFIYKLHLFRIGVFHMLLSTDRKWKKTPDSDSIKDYITDTKHIVFVRHGASKWNEVFNRGFGLSFPVRLVCALITEVRRILCMDSVFIDSPLSESGCLQAKALQNFVEKSDGKIASILRGTEGDSIIVSSNLRRALSTSTIGFWERLQRSQEKVHIMSSLQEVTFNIDGVALSRAHGYPELCDEELAAIDMSKSFFSPDRYYNSSENDGEKDVYSHGIDRIIKFAGWCFTRDEQTIIAGGHSLYFRYFFDTFLPMSSHHESRKFKMENCAVVSFTLQRGRSPTTGNLWYRVEEDSIEKLYLGFEHENRNKDKSQ